MGTKIKIRADQVPSRPSPSVAQPAPPSKVATALGIVGWLATIAGAVGIVLLMRYNARMSSQLEATMRPQLLAAQAAKATAVQEAEAARAAKETAISDLRDELNEVIVALNTYRKDNRVTSASMKQAVPASYIQDTSVPGPPMTPWGSFPDLQLKLEYAEWEEQQARERLAKAKEAAERRARSIDKNLLKVFFTQSGPLPKDNRRKVIRRYACELRNTSRDPMEGVRVDIFSYGRFKNGWKPANSDGDVIKSVYVLYMSQTEVLTLPPQTTKELEIPELLTGFSSGESRGGAEYEGFVVVVTDANDDVLFTSMTRSTFQANPKGLRDIRVGQVITKDFEVVGNQILSDTEKATH